MDHINGVAVDDAVMTPPEPPALHCRVVSDGRIGIENQALGLAEALARLTPVDIVRQHVARPSWIRAMRRAPARAGALRRHAWRSRTAETPLNDVAEALGAATEPDIWIGCGRAALAAARAQHRRSRKPLMVFVQDPRTGHDLFDLIIAPEHDGLARPNSLSIIGAPNRITPERIAAALDTAPLALLNALEALPQPRLAVLVGGRSKRHRLSAQGATRLADQLRDLRAQGVGLMITTSRRTPEPAMAALRALAAGDAGVVLWTGAADGPNPYLPFLAHAQVVLVTRDSTNMITDAASAGRPVLLADMEGKDGKLAHLYDALRASGHVRAFTGALEIWPVSPLLETTKAAGALLDAYEHKQARSPSG